jgi:hypothetical protein
VRPAALTLLVLVLELGWLGLWPLSAMLSHSPLFTAAIIQAHPSLASILQTAPITEPLGTTAFLWPATLLGVNLLALSAVYALGLLFLARTRGETRRTLAIVLGGAVLFQATLALMPGLFSQDVFSYIAYGRLAAQYDLNPYIWPPSVVRDASLAWVADVWRTYPSPYGPLSANLQWLLANVGSGLSIADQALVYRGVANVLLLVNLALAWPLLGRIAPTQRLTAFAALAWNPLLLFEVAGNAHNDVLMVTFCLFGLLVFKARSRGVWACVALSLGTLVKYLSGIGLVWLGLAAAARVHSWPRRVLCVLGLALLSLALAAAVAAPWLELPDSLEPVLTETAGVGYVNSLPHTLFGPLLGSLERPLELAIFGLYLLWEAVHVWREPTAASLAGALARSALVYVLVVSMSVQTWYLCLPVTLALTLGVRHALARVSLAYAALALPALYVSYYLRELTPMWVFWLYACVPLALLIPDLATWARARAHIPAAIGIRHHEQRSNGHAGAGTVVEQRSR